MTRTRTRTQRWWLGLGLEFDNLDSHTALEMDISPLSRVLVTIDNYKRHLIFPVFSENLPETTAKYPPLPEKIGIRMRPSYAFEWGGGGQEEGHVIPRPLPEGPHVIYHFYSACRYLSPPPSPPPAKTYSSLFACRLKFKTHLRMNIQN